MPFRHAIAIDAFILIAALLPLPLTPLIRFFAFDYDFRCHYAMIIFIMPPFCRHYCHAAIDFHD
jgi:hypothetical protein